MSKLWVVWEMWCNHPWSTVDLTIAKLDYKNASIRSNIYSHSNLMGKQRKTSLTQTILLTLVDRFHLLNKCSYRSNIGWTLSIRFMEIFQSLWNKIILNLHTIKTMMKTHFPVNLRATRHFKLPVFLLFVSHWFTMRIRMSRNFSIMMQ